MRLSTVLVTAFVAATGPALAADQLLSQYNEPVTDWSGFYAGVLGGVAGINPSITDGGGDLFDADGVAIPLSEIAGIAGVEAGFNTQVGSAIFGIGADLSWVGYDTELFIDPYTESDDPSDYYASAGVDWLATVRGKLGMANDNALVYVTGGLGIAGADGCGTDEFIDGAPNCEEPDGDEVAIFDDIAYGFVAGVGAEAMLTENISVKAEYLYFQTMSQNVVYDVDSGPESADFNLNTHILRGGVAYHF